MKKSQFIAAAMLLSLASCTTSDDIFTGSEELAQQANQENAINFGTFVGDAKQTRAGATGDIVAPDAGSGNKLGSAGYEFGVFGYYHDNTNYDDASSTPNYMYNQKVEYTGDPKAWTYTPIKYWPNEFDTTDGKSAGVDKLTFFAYAPFVENTPGDGSISSPGTSGILAFVEHNNGTNKYTNNTGGDPRIHFNVDADPTKCVDLLWGVAPSDVSTTPFDYEIKHSATTEAGKPWKDVTKQTTDGKVTFDFKHALAKLTFTVDADVDDVRDGSNDHDKALADGTKIFVRKVVIKGKGMTDEAYLNLNNTTADAPLWEKDNGDPVEALASDQVFTFHDGRTDRKEGNADKTTPDSDSGNSATETVVGLNEAIIQSATTGSGPYTFSDHAGVTNSPVALLSNGGAFYVIPTSSGATKDFTIQIIYDVLTKDDNLAGTLADDKIHGSLVKNDISQTVNFAIQAGKVYAFKLHLGMTSVKMEGSVSGWGDPDAKEVDLPINKTTPTP